MEIATGKVITDIRRRHTSADFVAFSFFADNGVGETFSTTCVSTDGQSITVTGPSPVFVPGFTSEPTNQTITCTVTATEGVDTGTATGVGVLVAHASPGCTGTVTAPTNLSSVSMAFPGAVVSWAPVVPSPASCLVGYLVTPTSGSTALNPTFVLGHGTTTNVLNLTEGSTYTFTVAAVTGSGAGPASAPTASVTIGAPGAVTAVKAATAGKGAITVSFKAGRSNGAAIKSFTATCGSKSASGKASPLTVKDLTAGKTYTCTVTAANSRGKGASARSGAVKA